jgi:hypothetical protein
MVSKGPANTPKKVWVSLEDHVAETRAARMQKIDESSPEMRALFNEYGSGLVFQFINLGITNPRHIRHLVERTLDEFSPTRGSYSKQGIRTEHDR